MNTQILEEASVWFIEISEGPLDVTAREAFNRWLRTSPEHVRAYLETAAIWENASSIDKGRLHDADQLVAMASRNANVVPLGKEGQREKNLRASSRPRLKPLWALAASVTLAVGGALAWFVLSDVSTYRTSVGEQRSIVLSDGSMVTLNSSSRIRVEFNEHHRAIVLLKGQALFTAARDPARPFTVSGGKTQVVALGTQFDIDLRQRGTVVTVLEGRVAVSGEDVATAGAATTLSAGEQIIVSGKRFSPVRTNVAAATAWTQRRLMFSLTPLSDVAEEYNRHHARPLIVSDPALEHVNISGSFSSIDAASLIDFLRAQPEIAVRETPSAFEIIAAPNPKAK